MHIPDGFLDAKVAGSAAVLAVGGLWATMRRLPPGVAHRKVPLMGVCAAFVFVAQLVNFPVAAGTSGHLIGAVLTAVLLGPAAASVVMTAVLVVQALLFADGGVLALGANVLNMALVAVFSGAAVFGALRRAWPTPRGFFFATAFASWCSIVAASAACAVELALSGTVSMRLALPAMTGVHMLVGLGEALITTLVIAAIARARPDLVELPGAAPVGPLRGAIGLGLAASLGVLALAPFASGAPDGLERVAADLGFASHAAEEPLLAAPFAAVGPAPSTTLLVGVIGAAVAFLLAFVLSRALGSQHDREHGPHP
jgi:cobalt/nickel transport system permease protein